MTNRIAPRDLSGYTLLRNLVAMALAILLIFKSSKS
jgi:hypothetical protein